MSSIMQVLINPGVPVGTVTPPASKSMMQRACAGALLHKGKTTIVNPGSSEDDLAALNIIQQLGARILSRSEHEIQIVSSGSLRQVAVINCGESGLGARMFTPVVALLKDRVRVTGEGSLLRRPMHAVKDILSQVGVNLPGFNSYLPVTIHGPLQPRNVRVDGSASSQYLTGLLFAFSAAAQEVITVDVADLNSRPYIDLTIDILSRFGKPILNKNYESFVIDPSSFTHQEAVVLDIEADWSSAAYWLSAAAINGKVTTSKLNISSRQADKAIVEVLRLAGATVVINDDSVSVTRAGRLAAFRYDATDTPDLFPVLAVLAASCSGTSEIKGLSRLTHKESNRTSSISDMLGSFGVQFEVDVETLKIVGRSCLKAATIDSHTDHRIAMAAAIGALNADGPVIINNAQAVAKSYPQFFKHLAALGINLEEKY